MKIVVDYFLLKFIQEHHCPELPLDNKDKRFFRKLVDFSSVDINERPIKDTYLAIGYNGNSYSFTCAKEQIKQGLEIIAKSMK